jgi:hypothetical protein
MAEIVQNEKKSKVKGGKKAKKTSTQIHLRVAEITNDTIILKNGAVRSVLDVSSINFSLKSEDEQTGIIKAYQNFLNTLDFPLQIVVQSKKLDLDNYLADLKKRGESQENPLLQDQTFQYVDYIERLLEYADIMEKNFYVVVPYETVSSTKVSMFTKFLQRMKLKQTSSDYEKRKKSLANLKKSLDSRVSTVIAGLETCGLKVNRLKTQELIELMYKSYNPETARNQKVKDVSDFDLGK